ncbi:MAG: arginase [Pyrinomonadaceae bacterium]
MRKLSETASANSKEGIYAGKRFIMSSQNTLTPELQQRIEMLQMNSEELGKLIQSEIEQKDYPGKGKKVGMIGVPLGFGAGQIGSELGITAIRLTKIRGKRLIEHIQELGYKTQDYGDVEIVKPIYFACPEDNPKYLPEMIKSSRKIADAIEKIFENNEFPVILSGDHSSAIGTFSGISSYFHQKREEIGLIWVDAHADLNTPETSPSGNLHGMPLAVLLGKGNQELVNLHGFAPKLSPKYLAHIGGRDFDAGEKKIIRGMNMREQFFTMSDIDRRGMQACVEDAVKIASQAPAGFAVTFDVDILDPRFAPGSGTLVRGGVTYREAHLALEIIAELGKMRSFEVVEVNPLLNSGNVTVELAGELILSALGKTIL